MKQAFYISELRITGKGVPDAQIQFENGMNYITGPSNTGKSYIYQCIDYIFGAKKIKQLQEFKEYTNIYIEITLLDKSKQTFLRKIGDSTIILYKGPINEFDATDKTRIVTLASQQTAKKKDIGSYILNLIGINNVPTMLSQKQYGKTSQLTLRNFLKFFFVDETRIIDDRAQIIADHYSDTLLLSIFRYILTGNDDSGCIPVETPEIRKARINGRIEILNDLLVRLLNRQKEVNSLIDSIQIEENIENITSYQQQIDIYQKRINELSDLLIGTKRNYVLTEQSLSKEKAMLSRLALLKNQYISDMERIHFTRQGLQITSQMPIQECPFCHSKVSLEESEGAKKHLDNECTAETNRIQGLLRDLDQVIEKAQERVSILSKRYDDLSSKIKEITNQINTVTDSHLTPLSEIVEKYSYYNKLISDKNSLGVDIVTTNEELKKETEKLDEKVEESTYKPTDSTEEKIEFCQIIRDILLSWSVSVQTVNLTPKNQDICIDGQDRITNGKGYRALYFSAFIYAVLEYLQHHGRPWFPCILLDSPLTTLRGEDKTNAEDTQAVSKDIQDSMCLYIANIPNTQSIILENKEIKDDIASQAKVIRFTHSKDEGRFGLFPVK